MYCKVKFCRYAHTHVTAGHRCGSCKRFGHGQIECGKMEQNELQNSLNDRLPNNIRCTRPQCSFSLLHTTDAHQCYFCKNWGDNCVCVFKKCPTCMSVGSIESFDIFTSSECIICIELRPVVVFKRCKHANICRECFNKLV
jgi:hypothetical protein